MKKYCLFVLPVVLLLTACSKGYVDPYKAYRQKTASQIYHHALHRLATGKYEKAAKDFEALNAVYPFGPYAEPGQLDLIYAYYKNDEAPSAVAAADRYIRLYPQNPHVAYAYYMSGVVQFYQGLNWIQHWWGTDPSTRALNYKEQAFMAFSQLARRYPHSPCVPDAIVRMHYIRNVLARQELLIADYYFQRGAYVAAANRASHVIQHYDGTPSVIPALSVMIRSYRALHVPQLAGKTLRIFRASYPQAPELKQFS